MVLYFLPAKNLRQLRIRRCVLVGLNGSGKSSLLALMAGRRMDSGSGEPWRFGRDLG